jgi:carbamoyl-phosphate synthase large subunit
VVPKFSEGLPGNAVERILAGEIDLVINTPFSSSGNSGPRIDGYEIRTACVAKDVPCVTTVSGAAAAVQGIEAVIRGDIDVRSLQDWHRALDEARRKAAA